MNENNKHREFRERATRRPLSRMEIDRFERYLEESGYKAKMEALEKQLADILAMLESNKSEY